MLFMTEKGQNEVLQAVFVYGTLMRGQRAHSMLAGCRCGGNYLLEDYAMYDLGRYPGIKPLAGGCVPGEVYFADPDTVTRMDAYEGKGELYDRVSVSVQVEADPTRTLAVQVYVYRKAVCGAPMRGRWGVNDGKTE